MQSGTSLGCTWIFQNGSQRDSVSQTAVGAIHSPTAECGSIQDQADRYSVHSLLCMCGTLLVPLAESVVFVC